jgi:hypothetical protein
MTQSDERGTQPSVQDVALDVALIIGGAPA